MNSETAAVLAAHSQIRSAWTWYWTEKNTRHLILLLSLFVGSGVSLLFKLVLCALRCPATALSARNAFVSDLATTLAWQVHAPLARTCWFPRPMIPKQLMRTARLPVTIVEARYGRRGGDRNRKNVADSDYSTVADGESTAADGESTEESSTDEQSMGRARKKRVQGRRVDTRRGKGMGVGSTSPFPPFPCAQVPLTWDFDPKSEEEEEGPSQQLPEKVPPVTAVGGPLHREIVAFEQGVMARTALKRDMIDTEIKRITHAAKRIWPSCRVVMSGSQSTGLSLPGGDVDIVILGVAGEIENSGARFSMHERGVIAHFLEILLQILREERIIKDSMVIIARVPIIKGRLVIADADCDISVGAGNAAAAVELVNNQLSQFISLRPLMLVLKQFLRQHELNEVHSGGLGSYTLLSMVIAHIQGFGDDKDLGQSLIAFFREYGDEFDYKKTAVSIRRGGRIHKHPMWRQGGNLLAVEDPQQAGRDIGSASWRIDKIVDEFSNANFVLEVCLQQFEHEKKVQRGADKMRESDNRTFPILGRIGIRDIPREPSKAGRSSPSRSSQKLLRKRKSTRRDSGSQRFRPSGWQVEEQWEEQEQKRFRRSKRRKN